MSALPSPGSFIFMVRDCYEENEYLTEFYTGVFVHGLPAPKQDLRRLEGFETMDGDSPKGQ
ncbi:hypothetical protein E2C01_038171 [Portunus trituberculatus]|uniref:Uncharacterized protein n=1 Tax=Portunus trituberculatus TaxID=210409 RepID=A0A5B7FHT5_PORTR|nr:hypothetical protein [Portunus trituberculatus]